MSAISEDLLALAIRKKMKKTQDEMKTRCKYLDKHRRENEFLNEVADDYKNHFKIIYIQKQQQEHRLRGILEHLDKVLANQKKLTKYALEKSKIERKNILGEIGTLKEEIDDIYPLAKDELPDKEEYNY
tara:strand:+ start:419 stop:805 length:387 start_codon:yes stop_codon:yes gene_type:complete